MSRVLWCFLLTACSSGLPTSSLELYEPGVDAPTFRLATLDPIVSIPFRPEGMALGKGGSLLYLGMEDGYCQSDTRSGEVTPVPTEVIEWFPWGSTVVDSGSGGYDVLMTSGEVVGTGFWVEILPHLQVARMGFEGDVVALRGDGDRCSLTRFNGGGSRTEVEVDAELCWGDLAVDRRRTSVAWVANGDLWRVGTTAEKVASDVGSLLQFEPTLRLPIVSDGEVIRAVDPSGAILWEYRDTDELVRFVTGGSAGLVMAAYTGVTDRLVALDASTGQVMLDEVTGYADHLQISQKGDTLALHDSGDVYIYALETTEHLPDTPRIFPGQ